MFPSKVVIASTDQTLNLTLVKLLRNSGWADIQIVESWDGLFELCCLSEQEILIFLCPSIVSLFHLPDTLQSLRKNFHAILILILNPQQVDDQTQSNLAKVIDGFILQPVNEYSLVATLHMARERRQRELELLKSEEKFQSLFHKSTDPSLLIHNQVIIDCNQAALDNLGAERSEVIGKSPIEISSDIQPDGSASNEKVQYRPAWKEHEVISYLREQAGKQFDPKVVEAFLELISEFDYPID